jgi:hypothetical protein
MDLYCLFAALFYSLFSIRKWALYKITYKQNLFNLVIALQPI